MAYFVSHEIGKDPFFKIWHAMDEHLIIYMHSDGGSIVCSEKTYPICEGVLCFIGAGKYHYTIPDNPDQYDRSKFNIPEQMIADIPDNGFLGRFCKEAFFYAVIPEERRGDVEQILAELAGAERDARYRNAIYQQAMLRLLILLDRYSLAVTQPTTGFINKAVEYVCDNIFHELTIDEICRAIHVSKYHFCRSFHAAMGMTVMEYILKTRIVMASSLLRKESASVTEISERCGFSGVSYFCRVFKEETGKTPLAYRREFVKKE